MKQEDKQKSESQSLLSSAWLNHPYATAGVLRGAATVFFQGFEVVRSVNLRYLLSSQPIPGLAVVIKQLSYRTVTTGLFPEQTAKGFVRETGYRAPLMSRQVHNNSLLVTVFTVGGIAAGDGFANTLFDIFTEKRINYIRDRKPSDPKSISSFTLLRTIKPEDFYQKFRKTFPLSVAHSGGYYTGVYTAVYLWDNLLKPNIPKELNSKPVEYVVIAGTTTLFANGLENTRKCYISLDTNEGFGRVGRRLLQTHGIKLMTTNFGLYACQNFLTIYIARKIMQSASEAQSAKSIEI